MADLIFEHPRLVAIYDALDPDRADLDVYSAIVEEFGARRSLDVGCGTGTFSTSGWAGPRSDRGRPGGRLT